MNESAQIAAVLLGLALGGGFITALIALRRAHYQAPDREPYAGFRDGNGHLDGGQLVLLPCEGDCPGTRAHETDGEGGATCALCGTHRSVPRGLAAVDES